MASSDGGALFAGIVITVVLFTMLSLTYWMGLADGRSQCVNHPQDSQCVALKKG